MVRTPIVWVAVLLASGAPAVVAWAAEPAARGGSGHVDVRDFAPPGAVADGKYDWNSPEHPYLQDAIDSITDWQAWRKEGTPPGMGRASGTVVLPAGTFRMTRPLRVPTGLRMVGAGWTSTILRGEHAEAAAVDMKGAQHCALENLAIHANGPKVALLLGRLAGDYNSAGEHRFNNVWVEGIVREALVYAIGSEGNLWDHCHFQLAEQAPAKHLFYLSRHDDLAVADCADSVNTVHTFVACMFLNLRARNGVDDDQVDALYINTAGCQYVLLLNCYLVTDAGCWVRLSVPASGFGPIHFLGCGNELFRSGPVSAGIILEAPNANHPTFEGLWFDNSAFAFQGQPAVRVDQPLTLVNFRYNLMASNGAGGALRLHSLRESEVRVRDNPYYDGVEHGRAVEIAGDALDNTFYGPLHQFVVRGLDLGNVYRDSTGAGLAGFRRPVLARAQDHVLGRSMSGLVLTNQGAAGPVVFGLPAAEPGLHFTLVKSAAPALTVLAAEGDAIGSAGALTSGDAAAASVTLTAVDDRLWVVTAQSGAWVAAAGSR